MKMTRNFFVIMAVVSVMLSTTVHAESHFNGGLYFDYNNGAVATIETQDPNVSSNSAVAAWAMTCDGGYQGRYAQVGWAKFAATGYPQYFYEYSYAPNNVWYRKMIGTATAGSHNEYMVGCDSTTMYFKINGTSYGTVPLSTIPFTRFCVQIFAETKNTADQCPGSVSNPVTMGNSRYKTTDNEWVPVYVENPSSIGYGTLTTMRNNISSSGSRNWEVWDSRY